MYHQLASRNDDIWQLVEKGFAVAFDANPFLIVRDIPYLDNEGMLKIGAIVTKFVDKGGDEIAPEDHQIFFAGSHPHALDGTPIPNLGGGPASLTLSEASNDVIVQRNFSNKPPSGFSNFLDKIESYVAIICGPAIEKYSANPYTFRVAGSESSVSPFKVRDTLTSRAEIGDLAAQFADDVIAIIGLGGTGAYVLDFIVKTPVREVRAFDQDLYFTHNTFRSPGKLDLSEVGKSKAEVYQARYESFRGGLAIERKFIDASSAEDLNGVTFAFVCVDKGSSRAAIFDLLIAKGIPFIDVGMGLNRTSGTLNGMLRTTYFSTEQALKLREKGLVELGDGPNDLYRSNIQIGELNALNACLAVIRFKQLRGFYLQEVPYYHLLFGLNDLKLVGNAENDSD